MDSPWTCYDALHEQVECGPSHSYCQQCERLGCTDPVLCTPDYFNEAYIFGPFFGTSTCPSGSYCPDGATLLACPPARPYSPAGSSSLANCTCSAGICCLSAIWL